MYAVILGLCVAFYCLLLMLDRRSTSSQEPTHVLPPVPLIGHIIGLVRESFFYFGSISQTVPDDILTITLPGQKFYIIKTPSIVQAIGKRQDAINHLPLVLKFSGKACGLTTEATDIMARYVTGDLQGHDFIEKLYSGMRVALAPGAELDRLNTVMGSGVLEHFATYDFEGQPIHGLYEWMKDTVAFATTRAIYGRRSPFNDPEVMKAFWTFESGLIGILFSPFPSLTSAKATEAREKVARAIEKYYVDGSMEEDGSQFTRARHRELTRIGLSELDTARLEVAGSFATFANTAPVAFWLVRDICNEPDLLRDIRKELDAIVIESSDGSTPIKTIEITTVVDRCPLLVSTYREVLRLRSVGGLARLVQEDVSIDVGGGSKRLLKKDAILQFPSNVFHHDARFWGSDAAAFRPRRFMAGEPQQTASGKRPNESSFRVFGAGKSLCPGRFFAMAELLVLVGITLLRYDLEPQAAESGWPEPTTGKTNITTLMRCPDDDIKVRVRAREGSQKYKWVIKNAAK